MVTTLPKPSPTPYQIMDDDESRIALRTQNALVGLREMEMSDPARQIVENLAYSLDKETVGTGSWHYWAGQISGIYFGLTSEK